MDHIDLTQPGVADEILAWIEVAEEQWRLDRGEKKAQIETDRINRAACERATRLWCEQQARGAA